MKYVPAWTLFTHLRALTSLHARRDMTPAVLENNLIRDLTAQTLAKRRILHLMQRQPALY